MNITESSNSSLKGIFLIIIAGILWGTTGTSQALGPDSSNPLAIGAMRLLIAGTSLMVICYLAGGFREKQKWPIGLLFLGAGCVALYQVTFFAGVSKAGVAIGTVVGIGSSPIFAGCLEAIILKKRPSKVWFLSTCFAILGCGLLAFSDKQEVSVGTVSILGVGLALCAGVAYAVYTIVIKSMLKTCKSMEATALVFFLGAIFLSPLLFYVDLTWLKSVSGIVMVVHLGIFTTALAYILFGKGLETVPVSTAVTLSLTEPLTAAFLGVVVLGESLNTLSSIGLAFIFASVILITLVRK
ncbi:MAG: DMT family transporter [Desulfotalea sp.]